MQVNEQAVVRQQSAGGGGSFAVAWRRVWLVALLSRIVVLAIGMGAMVTIGPNPANRPPRVSDNVFVDLTSRWDVGWYIGLANRGYDRDRVTARHDRTAFFPAWPLTLRSVAQFVPRNSAAWAWTGALLSILLFSMALAQVHRTARLYVTLEQADAAVLLLAFYPFAFCFSVGYSESLYLLAAASAWYATAAGQTTGGLTWGTVVGLTRPNGVTMCLPLFLCTLSEPSWNARRAMLAAGGPLLGVAGFSLFLWFWIGVPWQWLAAQDSWGRAHVGLGGLLSADLQFLRQHGLYGLLTARPFDVFNMLGLSVLALTPLVYRHMGLGAALLGPLALLPALAVGGWPSFGRYSAVVFPAFIALAGALPARHVPVFAATSAILAGLASALFFTFRPLY